MCILAKEVQIERKRNKIQFTLRTLDNNYVEHNATFMKFLKI